MRIAISLALSTLLALTAGLASAETGAPETPPAEEMEEAGWVPLGGATRAWLERQRSGAEQSPHSTGLTPPEEYRSRTRHLDSFTHPIPPLFDFESLSTGSDG